MIHSGFDEDARFWGLSWGAKGVFAALWSKVGRMGVARVPLAMALRMGPVDCHAELEELERAGLVTVDGDLVAPMPVGVIAPSGDPPPPVECASGYDLAGTEKARKARKARNAKAYRERKAKERQAVAAEASPTSDASPASHHLPALRRLCPLGAPEAVQ